MNRSLDADLAADPILIPHKGRLVYLFPSGRMVPMVSGGEGDEPQQVTMTQEALDALIETRLNRDRAARAATPPADYDDLKAKAAKFDELEAANQPALERASAAATALQQERDAAIAERDAATKTARDLALRNAVTRAAVAGKAVDPDDVFALLPKDAVTIGDDGQVTGAAEAVKALLEAKPHLVGEQRMQSDDGQGQRTGSVAPGVSAGRDMFAASRAKSTTGAAS